MKKILLVKSSVRDVRVADPVEVLVQAEIKNYPEIEVSVADFKAMPLPFMTSATIPSADDFVPQDENVKKWLEMVDGADAVVFLTAEYNHSYTPAVKNAIDWGFTQWHDKPVAFIGYGWVGAARAIKHLREVMSSLLAAKVLEPEANLRFMKEIGTDGSVMDEAVVREEINKVLSAL